jgi:hypothetical protein
MNSHPVLLAVGDFSQEHIDLGALCAQFGWCLKQVPALDDPSLDEKASFAAGLVDTSLDGGSCLRLACHRFPDVLWIACSRFSSSTSWGDLERLGAFHYLHRPLCSAEFLHALGFVDAVLAQQKRLEAEWNASNAA